MSEKKHSARSNFSEGILGSGEAEWKEKRSSLESWERKKIQFD